jgi:hypothetical protein
VTDSSTPGNPAAGWYPITPGSPQLRWWDGAQWTEQFHTLGVTEVPADHAPEGTKPNTVWIWIFAVIPLLQIAQLPLVASFYLKLGATGLTDPSSVSTVELSPTSGYLALQGLGFLFYALYIVFAALDHRALKARGVPRPFAWPWAFLGALVYIIGRTVVVRRRTGAGLAPLFVTIGTMVIELVVAIAVIIPSVTSLLSSVS